MPVSIKIRICTTLTSDFLEILKHSLQNFKKVGVDNVYHIRGILLLIFFINTHAYTRGIIVKFDFQISGILSYVADV